MKKIELIKENSKSDVYQIDIFKITIPSDTTGFVFVTESNQGHAPLMAEIGDQVAVREITIENTNSNKKTTKRCLQEYDDIVEGLERDFNASRDQFPWHKVL